LVEDEEEDESESESELESLPQAAVPRHMVNVQTAAAALKKEVLRMGPTLVVILDFLAFKEHSQHGVVEWEPL
jgi:hypothetical protein